MNWTRFALIAIGAESTVEADSNTLSRFLIANLPLRKGQEFVPTHYLDD
jgi:hypothetical protein